MGAIKYIKSKVHRAIELTHHKLTISFHLTNKHTISFNLNTQSVAYDKNKYIRTEDYTTKCVSLIKKLNKNWFLMTHLAADGAQLGFLSVCLIF